MYIYLIITLSTLNLCNAVRQLYLNKAGKMREYYVNPHPDNFENVYKNEKIPRKSHDNNI